MEFEQLKKISKSGQRVLVSVFQKKCECCDELYSEADIDCPICKGAGEIRLEILTPKIRYYSENEVVESDLLSDEKNDVYIFYFPIEYNFLTYKDKITILKVDDKNTVFEPLIKEQTFKIFFKEKKFFNKKSFIKIKGEKIVWE